MSDGNRLGWTFDTILVAGAIAMIGMVSTFSVARRGDAKAVEVALAGATKGIERTTDDTDRQFKAMGEKIEELATTVNQGLAGFQSAMKLLAGLVVIVTLGSMAYSIMSGS